MTKRTSTAAQQTDDQTVAAATRTRTFRGRVVSPDDRLPNVRHDTCDGAPVVWVELSGRHGQGKEMLLDAADWPVAQRITPWWTVVGADHPFVASGRTKTARLARQSPTSRPNLPLARVLAGANKPGWAVWYRDRNPLNLRRSNLELLTKAEFYRRVRDILWLMPDVTMTAEDWRIAAQTA